MVISLKGEFISTKTVTTIWLFYAIILHCLEHLNWGFHEGLCIRQHVVSAGIQAEWCGATWVLWDICTL